MGHPNFAEGDIVLILDDKQRSRYAVLEPGKKQGLSGDQILHDRVIGQPVGSEIRTRRGRTARVLTATLQDHISGMPKHAAIINPKDIAAILMHGDIRPGHRVVEGGYGSGALTTALLQAVGPTGRVSTYENRQEAANRGAKNVHAWLGEPTNHTVHIGDIYEGIEEQSIDRVVMDVPEPWQVLTHARAALVYGGGLTAYLPTILQVQRLVLALQHGRAWCHVRAIEVLERSWHITAQSVRPDHQMIGHTGFLVFARRGAEAVEAEPEESPDAAPDAAPDEAVSTEP
jgi:tRNA (adenine57-N1/adenine58-N1)-methyltransferase catalytic subunit